MRRLLHLSPLLLTLTLHAQQPAPAPRTATTAKTSEQDQRINQAEALLEKGDFKAAETVLLDLAKANPNDATVQYDLGFTQERNGEDQAAAKSYAAAIAADPNTPEPRLALGLLEARAGHNDAARTQLDAVAKSTIAAPQLRGRALRALARLNEVTQPDLATDQLIEATKLTGQQPGDAELTASLAARAGDSAGAETALRSALQQTPGDPSATASLAAILQRQGKLAEANALLAPALAAHPDDPQLVSRAAAVYAAEDKLPEAIALLDKLRSADPKVAADPALTRMLAHLQLLSGDAAAAEPLYRQLASADPNDPTLLDDFGSTLVREQKFAEAQTVLTRAVEMRQAFHDDAAWAETAGHLAFAASRNHQPEVTLQALADRATVLPNSAASLFLEATAHDALHQRRQAEQSYRAFLAVANGKLPDEEFEARHRLVALEHEH